MICNFEGLELKVRHRLDDLEKHVLNEHVHSPVRHRLDDLERKQQVISSLVIVRHRLDDLEKCLHLAVVMFTRSSSPR